MRVTTQADCVVQADCCTSVLLRLTARIGPPQPLVHANDEPQQTKYTLAISFNSLHAQANALS